MSPVPPFANFTKFYKFFPRYRILLGSASWVWHGYCSDNEQAGLLRAPRLGSVTHEVSVSCREVKMQIASAKGRKA